MGRSRRIELATGALAGYANGPDAPTTATSLALEKVERSRAVILVEGISDQIAVETLALRRGRDLDGERIAVLPVGGFHAIERYLRALGPLGAELELAGLCDADAAPTVRDALAATGVGQPETTAEMATVGFHVCDRDLEDELIRAAGTVRVEAVLDAQGELGAFRTLQKQPQWRGRPTADQLHRFLGSQARRSLRYARLLIGAIELDRLPPPLDAVLAQV